MDSDDYRLAIAERIDGLKQPYEHGLFIGQETAQAHFLAAANSGRLHHAWLLNGPRGSGKATFAFRLARHFAEMEGDASALSAGDLDAAASPGNPAFRKIATGGHPNVLHLRIPYDEKTKKFKTQLTVDEIRRSVGFFGTTAGDKGWRIAIVDSANDMNASAANALLKILEEPPARTLFFLISDRPGRLLPTIRSRCQRLEFSPLDTGDIAKILSEVADGGEFDPVNLPHYRDIVGGSVRRAYQFAIHDAAALFDDFNALLRQRQDYDIHALHRFADRVSGRGEDEKFRFFVDFLENRLLSKVRGEGDAAALVSWAEVWDKMHARLDREERLNLDRKQTVLALFYDLRAVDLS